MTLFNRPLSQRPPVGARTTIKDLIRGSRSVLAGIVVFGLLSILLSGMKGPVFGPISLWLLPGAEAASTFAFALQGAYGVYSSPLRLRTSTQRLLLAGIAGILTGVAGGAIRDFVFLHQYPVLLKDITLSTSAILGAVAGVLAARVEDKELGKIVLTMDLVATATAVIVGTDKGLAVAPQGYYEIANCAAVVCSFLTAFGGGIASDYLVFQEKKTFLGAGMSLVVLGTLLNVMLVQIHDVIGINFDPDYFWILTVSIFVLLHNTMIKR